MMIHDCDLQFIEECLNEISYKLQHYPFPDDEMMESGDIVYMITERENTDGSWYCNLAISLKRIGENFSFIYRFCNNHIEPKLLRYQNILEDPERFYVFFMIELYDFLLSQVTSELNLDYITKKDIPVIVDYIKHLNFDDPVNWF